MQKWLYLILFGICILVGVKFIYSETEPEGPQGAAAEVAPKERVKKKAVRTKSDKPPLKTGTPLSNSKREDRFKQGRTQKNSYDEAFQPPPPPPSRLDGQSTFGEVPPDFESVPPPPPGTFEDEFDPLQDGAIPPPFEGDPFAPSDLDPPTEVEPLPLDEDPVPFDLEDPEEE